MPGRPTAAPAAHLGGRTAATKQPRTSAKPRPRPIAQEFGPQAPAACATGGPLTRDPPPP